MVSNCEITAHDVSYVNGIQLDLFVYPKTFFDKIIDFSDFVQLFEGVIVLDIDGSGKTLMDRVSEFIKRIPEKSEQEVSSQIDWCEKMLLRASRGNEEGFFRWHWLLVDSLEIFCDILRQKYHGPKKALQWMKSNHEDAFVLYSKAIQRMDYGSLQSWISFLRLLGEQQEKCWKAKND